MQTIDSNSISTTITAFDRTKEDKTLRVPVPSHLMLDKTKSSYVTTLRHKTGQIQNKYCTMMSSHSSKHHYKIIEERSKNQEYKRKCVANAKTEQSFDYDPRARDPKSVMNSVKDRLVTFYEFTRPYSAIGVVLETTSVSLLAVERSSDLSLMFFKGWLQG
ncbi:hypothetical protein RIF29_04172 [Crotalaria pallida]|uniref:Uncharacterized protein n=1 Tax=Crotalaria pallida TaxID=3830 RepID=A0AAN9P956_CROPI